MSFSTVFQSYQYDERVIMKGCVHLNPVYDSKKNLPPGIDHARDRLICRPAIYPLSYRYMYDIARLKSTLEYTS